MGVWERLFGGILDDDIVPWRISQLNVKPQKNLGVVATSSDKAPVQ